jgi:glycosyltransferase involved in cell wall biosynthesis
VLLALVPSHIRRLTGALRGTPVSVLHVVNGGYPGALTAQMATVAARRAGCRGVAMTVANVPQPATFPRVADQVVDRLVRRSVGAVVVATDGLARCLVERRGFQPDQMTVIPHGIREPYPDPNDEPAGTGPVPLSRSGGGLVGMVARFVPEKGHLQFVDAFARLRARCPDARAVLVGDGPTRGAIEARLRALGLERQVTLTGHRPLTDTLRLMRTFDVVALSSEYDGMPYAILHAMSLRKPVVATTVGAIPDVVVSSETGLLVPPGDPAALADALATLLESPARARALGQAGHARYRQLFRLEPMVEQHTRLYERLANGDRRGGGAG